MNRSGAECGGITALLPISIFVNVFSANAVSSLSTSLYVQLFNTSHAFTRGRECQKRSQRVFCSKTHLRSVGDIPLNPTLHKNNVNKVNILYCIVLILLASCSFDVHFHYIDNAIICIA